MTLRKYRWSKTYEASEEELASFLGSLNIEAERWVADEYEDFSKHKHQLNKHLWCVEGSIEFIVDGKSVSLQAGDALDLPAETVHEAKAGFSGCVCYEFPRINDNPEVKV